MDANYTSTRTFTITDSLENGDYLFKTEYGSLLTEEMLKSHLMRQFLSAMRHVDGTIDNPQLRITVELCNMPVKQEECEEAA